MGQSTSSNKAPSPANNLVFGVDLIISVNEARKLLGVDGKSLSDNQVKDLIVSLTSMAEQFLQNSGS